jgi:C-terminal processing protease CtpA/Prc
LQSDSEEETKVEFEVIHLSVHKGAGAMGFSINFTPDKSKPGFLSIGTVRQDSPAAKAGMIKDDYLLEVDGKDLQYATKEEGTAAIKETGVNVSVTVGRIPPVCLFYVINYILSLASCSSQAPSQR